MLSLTQRERQVLEELVAGFTNKEIAWHLQVSPRTIEVHRKHVMVKMGARNVVDLVRKVISRDKVA